MSNDRTAIRTLSPWAKIICGIIICVVCATLKTPTTCVSLATALAICTVLSRASVSDLLKTAKPLLIFMPFYAVLCLTSSGVMTAVTMLIKYVVFITAAALFTAITPHSEMISGLTALMSPLKRLHVPVSDIALVISVTLRFIPTIADEYAQIRSAQSSRGIDPKSLPLRQRIRLTFSALIPLFLSLFRRAEGLANAMDARCYDGNHVPRKKAAITISDVTATVVTIVFCTFLMLLEFLH